jgi:hypothetical protein
VPLEEMSRMIAIAWRGRVVAEFQASLQLDLPGLEQVLELDWILQLRKQAGRFLALWEEMVPGDLEAWRELALAGFWLTVRDFLAAAESMVAGMEQVVALGRHCHS